MKINDPFLITQHGGNDACGDKFRHSATSATCHFRVISLLQQNITKDTVKQVDNFYIHQYALAEQATESRINEILRDLLAIHADYYFISSHAQLHKEVYLSLTHYGYKVVVL